MNAFQKMAIFSWAKKSPAERLRTIRELFEDPDAGTLVRAVSESLPSPQATAFLAFVHSLELLAVGK